MLTNAGLVSHLVAFVAYWILAARLLRLGGRSRPALAFLAASLTAAAWALLTAAALGMGGGFAPAALVFETLRSVGWLLLIAALLDQGRRPGEPLGPSLQVAAALILLLLAQLAAALVAGAEASPGLLTLILFARLTAAIGGLVLVHNLYVNTAPGSRWSIRLLSIALAAIFAYDLNLYTMQLLVGEQNADLLNARGAANAIAVPLLWASTARNRLLKLRLSRQVVFHTLSLGAIGGYLVLMSVAAYLLKLLGGDWGRLLQISFVSALLVLAATVLFSGRFRAWARVQINKHFFPLKYEYRDEWLRFINTVSRADAAHGPLEERVIEAICQIVDSPGGALYTPGEGGRYELAARWNYQHLVPGGAGPDDELVRFMRRRERIIDFNELRAGTGDYDGLTLPAWAAADRQAWLAVPLLHLEQQLAGFVVVERSIVARELNWEDFDLLRTVGRQAATYIAEQASQAALLEARKFDEFNRRFAFIMHDIKNLVSQLSLVARNAERHADNPEFRADMVATLQRSVAKMNDLLARLGQKSGKGEEAGGATDAAALLRSLAEAKRRIGADVRLELPRERLLVRGDPGRLEQVVGHLLQNAIEASPERAPVHLSALRENGLVRLEVRDQGCGMSASFIRNELFRPFHSTKRGGFGIGAYEAREITRSLGGRLEVMSEEGEGTVFTVWLPPADARPERLSA